MTLRLAILSTHPIQYEVPIYRALASRRELESKVFFCWDFGLQPTHDVGFEQEVAWDVPLLDGYEHELLANRSPTPGTHRRLGLINPDAWQRIRAWKPDALVIGGYAHLTTQLVLRSALRARLPVLLRGDSSLIPRRRLRVRAAKRLVLPALLRRLAGVLCVGSHGVDYYTHYGVPRERIFCAPYTTDPRFRAQACAAREAARASRQELGLTETDRVVLYTGKLIERKGVLDLAEAFAARPRAGAALLIAGDGPLRPAIEARARGADARIECLGFVNQSALPKTYAMADLFGLPSRIEAWGVVVNEAMNLGVPVLASDHVGASRDLVTPDTGWTFPAGDVGALTRCLDQVLDDPVELARRGERAREHVHAWEHGRAADAYVRAAQTAAGG